MATLSPAQRLDEVFGKEKQNNVEGWIGDAIYGVNDGLGAIFGIVAGVAGYTSNSHTILISGLFGALASTLSMGAGAWLATKSENELMETTLSRARKSIENEPTREIETLSLIYQVKGFNEKDANHIAQTIAKDDAMFLETIAQEKHGLHESGKGNPWSSAISGSISTFVGAIVPLLPFFFVHGTVALIIAAIVSILAHFVVGAAKSLVTVRSWWSSGLEMTMAGIIVGVVSYGLGLLGNVLLG
ncbi:VIT1/CCC1 transporter family protein [Alicyclobacillus fastidiosus]|uniref:VIT1/CCC1 transporter family protein n=1 Tax=Alicyclobacillus fastidiosus TaxID=392011 RepID=A0ABY6ZID6_9BACL|nr:VIT1/CCC1 transporter family protein [Alicyclobacillus fastidiosus]WAH42673.1 VIT1/CCC1 transporter family protein [Alicyclobacillus fastidiosus]